MKKIIISSVVSVILLYIAYTLLLLTMNYEGVYQKFHKHIADAGYEAKTSSIDVVRFPVPHVDLGDISIPNLLTAKKLEIKFSLLSILMLNPTIKTIEISGVEMIIPKNTLDFAGHEKYMTAIMRIIPKLPKMVIYNLSLRDKATKNIYSHIDSLAINPDDVDNQLVIYWNDNDNTNLTYKKSSDGMLIHVDSIGEAYSLKLDELYSGDKFQSGSLQYSINNLQKFTNIVYQDVDLLVTKIQSPESLELTCKMQTAGDRIKFSDISVNSKSISMSGNMDIYRSQHPDAINLSFDFLDLKTLLASPNMDFVNESKSKQKLELDNVVRNFNITAKKIILADAELENMVFNALIDKKKLNINKLSADIIGGGEFSVAGTVTQNQYRSMFEGSIDLRHNDANFMLSKLGFANLTTKTPTNFVLESKVKATPIDYQLDDIFMKLGSFNIDGSASIKFIGNTPRINLTLGLSSVDLLQTEYPVLSMLVSYLRSLANDMGAKNYLTKYIPIREINYLGNFDVSFSDLYIGDIQTDKLRIISDVSPGKIILNSIYYQDDRNYLSGAGYIIAAAIKPEIGLKVTEGILKTSSFDVPHILHFFQALQNDYDLNKVNINTEVAIQHLKQNETDLQDFEFKTKNDGILWNISSLGATYGEGKFISSGSLRMDSMNLNLSYAYNDFNLKKVSGIIPLTLFGIEDGWASSNGMISSNGSNINQLFYNLYSKSSFITKDMKWDNFDVDNFIATVTADPKYPSSKLDDDAAHYMNIGSTMITTLEGTLELNHGIFKFSDVKFDTSHTASSTATAEYDIYNNKLVVSTQFAFELLPFTHMINLKQYHLV